jgi:5'-methylthioadenosine phosphorylase
MSIIGMTTSPEAFLAREAEMCYAVLAHVTDYDVWHLSEDPVTVEMVVRTLRQNAQKAEETIKAFLPKLTETSACTCQNALRDALITGLDSVPEKTIKILQPIITKYLDDHSQS